MYSKANGGANYMDFLAPGIVAMSILFTAVFSGLEVIWDRQFGFLKETLVAPISRTEIMIGKTLGGAAIAMIQGLIVLSVTYVLGFRIPSLGSLGLGLIFMSLIAIFFTGLGLAIASKMKDLHGFQLIMNFLIMPIFLLSGALFPLDRLPWWLAVLSYIDPLTYGVDGLRGILIGNSHFRVYIDLIVLGSFCLAMIVLARNLFQKTEV
jgi:ABC-2 type transport system permease protein